MMNLKKLPNQRSSDRHTVIFKTNVKIGAISTACKIIDISSGGARIKASLNVAPLVPVILTIKQLGDFDALIVWSNRDELGLKFDENPDRISMMLDLILAYGQRKI